MAKRKLNKSDKIREAFAEMGTDARPRDVIAALAAKKITVTPAAVSNIRTKLGNGHARNGHSDKISLDVLISAKKFAEQIGGIEKAKVALAALAKLS